jgi:hypothetical protein
MLRRITSCRKKKLEDPSENGWGAWAILAANSAVPIYTGQVPAMSIAGFFVPPEPTRPESRDGYQDSYHSHCHGLRLPLSADNRGGWFIIIPKFAQWLRKQGEANMRYFV